ncbi:MAG: C26 family cysteine hydrolase domain-containing family [candidate division WS1 bacterium]|nr:C26 family cysteine hydrolase domain-containing family [candidate division WS1 bacterium]
MILLVSLQRIGETYETSSGHHDLKCKLESLTDLPVLVQHYSQVNPELVQRLPIRAIFISGTSVPWSEWPTDRMIGISDVITGSDVPIFGACGGHQLIGHCCNNDLRQVDQLSNSHMRKLEPGEPDLNPAYHPGQYKEYGMWQVEILADDPIFESFDGTMMVRQSHAAEVKKLPDGFVHLARNDNCEIQAMRHGKRIMYSTQFHPEAWCDAYSDGKRFMENFFRIAGIPG